ncbi:MAG: hypothetical protein GXP33_16330 [Spirochaetes bacterium]|nr:hypothetical protein [Spirochaetota bacterium]
MKYLFIFVIIASFYTVSCRTVPENKPASVILSGSGDRTSISEKTNRVKQSFPTGPNKEKQPAVNSMELLQKAKDEFKAGKYAKCLSLTRKLRIEYPDSREILQALFLSGRAELKLKEPYRARYFFKKILSRYKENDYFDAVYFKTLVMLADLLYGERLFDESLNYYLKALEEKNNNDISNIYLRIADINYYQKNNLHLARYYFLKTGAATLTAENRAVYERLKKNLEWEYLSSEIIGIDDGNVSAVAADGDDLWIGTWNGGIARYNVSMERSRVFKEGEKSLVPKTIRTIEVTKKRVWVGSYNGLSYYSKASSGWHGIDKFSKPKSVKIETIKNINGILYIGTLGEGLWFGHESGYRDFKKMDFPSQFINCMDNYGNYLLVGTMDMGLFFIDLKTKKVTSFLKIFPGFTALNITTILIEDDNNLWIGTYGKGLYHWKKNLNRIERYTSENGSIRDDWILSSVKTKKGLYFGTFGGGLIFFGRNKTPVKNLGLKDGLNSLDISAAAYEQPLVIFGTLGMGIMIFYEDIRE